MGRGDDSDDDEEYAGEYYCYSDGETMPDVCDSDVDLDLEPPQLHVPAQQPAIPRGTVLTYDGADVPAQQPDDVVELPAGACGLQNLLNSCYTNALAQALCFTGVVEHAQHHITQEARCRRKSAGGCNVAALLMTLQGMASGASTLSPCDLVTASRLVFGGSCAQQDVDELFCRGFSCFSEAFSLMLTYDRKCDHGHTSEQTDCHVRLTVAPNEAVDDTVQRCIDRYVLPERMQGVNALLCEQCGGMVRVVGLLLLVKSPCVTLHDSMYGVGGRGHGDASQKQFRILDHPACTLQSWIVSSLVCAVVVTDFSSMAMFVFRSEKITSPVGLNATVVLPNSDAAYDAVSIICHRGATASSGHYTALRFAGNGKWWLCDDHQVC